MIEQFDEVRIENTNACGYHCQMCPREKQTRPIGHLTMQNWEKLCTLLKDYSGTIHLHGFGESLLDRKLPEKIALLKKAAPNCSTHLISTLGVRVKDTYFETLLASGLNTLVVSLYGYTPETYHELHGSNSFERVKHNLILLSKAKQNHPTFRAAIKLMQENVHSTLPVAGKSAREAFEAFLKPLNFDVGYIPHLHNYGDGRTYNEPSNKPCPVLDGNRARVLQITWDLNIVPCCYDYNTTIPFGNLQNETLEEIFNSKAYLDFMISHNTNNGHSYSICRTCERHEAL